MCEIKVARSADPALSALDIWIYRTVANSYGDAPALVTRGRMHTGGTTYVIFQSKRHRCVEALLCGDTFDPVLPYLYVLRAKLHG